MVTNNIRVLIRVKSSLVAPLTCITVVSPVQTCTAPSIAALEGNVLIRRTDQPLFSGLAGGGRGLSHQAPVLAASPAMTTIGTLMYNHTISSFV